MWGEVKIELAPFHSEVSREATGHWIICCRVIQGLLGLPHSLHPLLSGHLTTVSSKLMTLCTTSEKMEAQRGHTTNKGCSPESNPVALVPKPAFFPLPHVALKDRVVGEACD